jgi:hypothetical protein
MKIVARLAILGRTAMVLLAVSAGLSPSTASASDRDALSRRGTYEGRRYTIEVPAGRNTETAQGARGIRPSRARLVSGAESPDGKAPKGLGTNGPENPAKWRMR